MYVSSGPGDRWSLFALAQMVAALALFLGVAAALGVILTGLW
jgi:hypothetical protein